MIKKNLRAIAGELIARDSDDHRLTAYLEMQKHQGWETHKAILVGLFQHMGNDLLSKEYTEKSAEDKDLIQRVYFELSDIIKFLLNPLKEVEGQTKIKSHNRRMAQTKGEDK